MAFLNNYSSPSKIKLQRAMTLIELLISISIIAVLASISNSWYQSYTEAARVNNAIAQITTLSFLINDYILENGEPPSSLSQINNQDLIDPWGTPYQYQKIKPTNFAKYSNSSSALNSVRTGQLPVPLNTDYDLYSKGSDGLSKATLSVAASQDDILRAGNGSYIGLASKF